MRVSISVLGCLLFVACYAGEPTNGPECRINSDCQKGWVCVDFACQAVCQSSSECNPSEACLDSQCVPYAKDCITHDDCEAGFYCSAHACTKQLPLGSPCGTENVYCASGFCADGVCCNTACDGTCESCVVGQSVGDGDDGTCGFVSRGEDPFDMQCSGPTACDGAGACYTKELGEVCRDNFECPTGVCADGVCCNGLCDGTCESCASGTCEAIANGTDPEAECVDAATCDGARGCWDKSLGDACEHDFECVGGICADGVCCNTRCEGTCQQCNATGGEGTCTSVLGATDVGTCDNDVAAGDCPNGPCTCNATGVCKVSDARACSDGGICDSGVCMGGYCCDGACSGTCMSCNSNETEAEPGACAPVKSPLDPRDECNGAAATACDGTGACYANSNGAACTEAYECASGYCVDGVCCASECTGTCYSCAGVDTVVAQAGVCSAIVIGKDPNNECPGPAVCAELGACTHGAPGETCTTDGDCMLGDCCGGICTYGWSRVASIPSTRNLQAVWGDSTGRVVAVGDKRTVLNNSSGTWVLIAGESTGSGDAWRAIAGSSSRELLLVGDGGRAARWDGSSATQPVSLTSVTSSNLRDVVLATNGVATAVGDSGSVVSISGTTMTTVASGTTRNLLDIWLGPSLMAAVGGQISGTPPQVYRAAIWLNGGSWQSLSGWTSSGLPTSIGGLGDGNLVLAWTDSNGGHIDKRVDGVWSYSTQTFASPVTHLVTAGDKLLGVSGTNVVIYDGASWRVMSTGSTQTLNNLWAQDECHAYAVGNNGTIVRR